jgi:hypothetical protein
MIDANAESQMQLRRTEMAVTVKTSGDHPASMEERIAKRLRPSGDPRADYHTQKGDGPTRTHTFGHHAGHVYDKSTAIQPNAGTTQRGADSATTQSVNPKVGGGR